MSRRDREADDLPGGEDAPELTRSEERLHVGTEREKVGAARAVKRVDTENVETLPDGSLSIPVFEEQIVVTKRLVVRERVVVRKHTVYEDHVVTADLKRERLEVQGDEGVVIHDEEARR
jgi:uncharacterized protein (TIGR02271 family)